MIFTYFLKVIGSNADHLDKLNVIISKTVTSSTSITIARNIMSHVGLRVA